MTAAAGPAIVTDFLVIGSGLAGLLAAIKASEHGSVALVTKLGVLDANTCYAQGGIACAALATADTFESHIADTLRAGAGLCDRAAVEYIIRAAPARICDLEQYGVHFTRRGDADAADQRVASDEYDLGREGGHSARRVLHAGDITGAEIMRALAAEARRRTRIALYEGHVAIDLLATRRMGMASENVCMGAYVLDRATETVQTFLAKATLLCTGGAGKVYLYTTNPDVATGDGIAMAWRAFAEVANLEFYQFHPTCLYHPKVKNFLISEALRGEGARLLCRAKDGSYDAFMERYHPLKDLAPRDIVARAIDKELKRSGELCVFLDIRHHPEEMLRKRFPNIFAKLLEVGINMAKDLIPVIPAAHYCCGGIRTDLHAQTGVHGLYAIGECAWTGLHGANRLASNSLLEAAVFAHEAVQHAVAHPAPPPQLAALQWDREAPESGKPSAWVRHIPMWHCGAAVDSDELVVVAHNWDEIRRFMQDYVGIFRTTKRLRKEIERYYWDFKLTADLIELRNIASVAEMIIDSALTRHESIGLHYNADYPPVEPSQLPAGPHVASHTILRRAAPVAAEFTVADAGQLK
jgi:L-aspartate oxidase